MKTDFRAQEWITGHMHMQFLPTLVQKELRRKIEAFVWSTLVRKIWVLISTFPQQNSCKQSGESMGRGSLLEFHQDELFFPNGRPTFKTANGICVTQEHRYAKTNEPNNKDFGNVLLSFILSDTLPSLTSGDFTGAISSLCTFVLKSVWRGPSWCRQLA